MSDPSQPRWGAEAQMPEAEKGLPMTQKWDPVALEREVAELRALESQPFFRRAWGYLKRTGPGLLQSAMTLGAGSATASVVAGASFGYKLLWVQPLAMFLGICMLAALGNVVLTTGERPYQAVGRELSKILALLWALGTIVASIIWHFPQYGLAAAAARDLGTMFGAVSQVELLEIPEGDSVVYYTQIETATAETIRHKLPNGQEAQIRAGLNDQQWNQLADQAQRQFTIFTSSGLALGWWVGLLILSINVFVVWSYGSSPGGIKLYEWFLRIVIGTVILLFAIVVLANLPKIQWGEMVKGFIGWYGIPEWHNPKHVTLVLGMLGAAVGINMTFLYPYSLLAKGWGPAHKKLAQWDLVMCMFIPFTLVTSLIMLAMTVTGVYTGDALRDTIQPVAAAQSLTGVMGRYGGRVIFNLGLIAMTCSAISTHMVVCGFTMCEMLGLQYTKARFRLFAMTPVIGILGVVTKLPFWFPVVASGICFAILPIAYVIFFLLNNKRSYIGDAVGRGWRRVVWNALLLVAIALATTGSVIQIKTRVIDELFKRFHPAPSVSALGDSMPGLILGAQTGRG